ncbi:MAG: 4,5-DOPA dioxygenase extradiol [Kiritimatiellaeota bacterium]|nr:4,5-DOPA dioxygenase extradiol [Kiritimatiellota bacterium]
MSDTFAAQQQAQTTMPVLFVGHGNPMNAIEDTEYSRAWSAVGNNLPRPKVILAISAHWEIEGAAVTAMLQPRTIHDFYGFPDELFAMRYPAPGAPALAQRIRALLGTDAVKLDQEWGLDHGTWSVLVRMFPKADVPVVQLSLNRKLTPTEHYALGGKLAVLRAEGVLVLCSGNIVHNLRLLEWGDKGFDWAEAFDLKLKALIEARDHAALIAYPKLGSDVLRAIPTDEHYLPLLYALALRQPEEPLTFFTEKVTLGSISMRSFQIG